jgi:aminopeptidase N
VTVHVRRSVLRLGLAAVPLGLMTVGTSPASAGVSSGGDPYFPLDGNAGYQVEHYRIVDTYRPGRDELTGRTVVHAVATQRLTRFHLDLALKVDGVQVDGVEASYSKPNRHELRVENPVPVAEGEAFRVVVDHHGRPGSTSAAGQSPFVHAPGEGVAVGQPQMGPWWFAANETPADKATYDIVLRVPRGLEAVSNGDLVSQDQEGELVRWHWRMDEPMTTYLAFFVAGQFRLVQSTEDGRPAVYAISEKLASGARADALDLMRTTPDVVAWLEEEFGPYPFSSIGGVVVSAPLSYLLETQSRPVYPFIGGPTTANVSLVVHEQAHQWFGNDVAVRRWKDIWLNEGWATYAEWLYAEEHGGRTVANRLREVYDAWSPSASFWDLRISNPGPRRMFADEVYVRGAMTLAALRNRVGAETLTEIGRVWVERNAGGHGTDAEFRALAEEISGEDLESFFQHWLDDTAKPADTAENGLS